MESFLEELQLICFLVTGKILQDDKTVESYNIQEKDFLVCLPAKVRVVILSSL